MALNTFNILARTIDHLGRGQIADAPTAVSELWKNAYDAYAKHVELKLYHENNISVAVISDDGIGMSQSDILEKWLVIGTDSKYKKSEDDSTKIPSGMEKRVKQGEKGIGRLSTAFLAPIALIVSKKINCKFVATLVDWRLFENPYLSLFDIKIPTEEFDNINDINQIFTKLRSEIKTNLGSGENEDSKRLLHNWTKFSELSNNIHEENSIYKQIENSLSIQYDLTTYLPYFQEDKWNLEYGTNIILFEIYDELSDIKIGNLKEDDENIDNLKSTLTGFVDPYTISEIAFDYSIQSIESGEPKKILDTNDVFGLDDFKELEHRFTGKFTEEGDFIGEVVAFGKNMGQFRYRPKDLSAKDLSEIGNFSVSIGSFEAEPRNSTLPKEKVSELDEIAKKFGGIFVYRDGMRVLPYGRPDADFLEIEKRRSKNAGTHFFSYRKTFGRIAITRDKNPALIDKAGREGFISNRQFRSFRKALIELLGILADRYFGGKSEYRKNRLSEVLEEKRKKEEILTEELRLKRRREFREIIRKQTKILSQKSIEINELSDEIKTLPKSSGIEVHKRIADKVKTLIIEINSLAAPTPPEGLANFEFEWRDYRDQLNAVLNQLYEAQKAIFDMLSLNNGSHDIFENGLALYDKEINAIIDKIDYYLRLHAEQIVKNLKDGNRKFREGLIQDLSQNKYNFDFLQDIGRAIQNANENAENIAYNLKAIEAGTNLKNIFEYSENQREKIKNELDDIRAVAQIGITVEIIGHELSSLEAGVKSSLARLPSIARETDAYKDSLKSLNALTERLRFLAPMKIAGYQPRERIFGNKIGEYIADFFANPLENHKIELKIEDSFKQVVFEGRPSRIYPALINIVNNAIYWVRNVEAPEITLSFRSGEIIIANNGPSVDFEDIDHLFELFFTRRREGRGVGLYLAKVNLAAEGQNLTYITDTNKMIYSNGANFSIKLKEVI